MANKALRLKTRSEIINEVLPRFRQSHSVSNTNINYGTQAALTLSPEQQEQLAARRANELAQAKRLSCAENEQNDGLRELPAAATVIEP